MAPVSTEYKLQCWGAAGTAWLGSAGRGGYAEGILPTTTNSIIYVCVGGSYSYNNQIENLKSFYYGQFGGGATSLTTTNRGELKNFASFKDEVLLVAGGGGGCEWNGTGGAGGGKNGQPGSTSTTNGGAIAYSYGTGGSQTSGGSYSRGNYNATTVYTATFGVGGIGAENGDFGAQGGSGWYGGGGSVFAGAAGGGSSYIDGVSNGKTIAGNASMPSPSGGTQTGQSGNGVCIITQTSF